MSRGDIRQGGVHLGVWIYFERMVMESTDGRLPEQFLKFSRGTEIEEVEKFLAECGIEREEYRRCYGDIIQEILQKQKY